MTRTAMLRTRCGCTQYLQVSHPPRPVWSMALLPDLRIGFDESLVDMEVDIKRRDFKFDGQTTDGILIYTEVYPT